MRTSLQILSTLLAAHITITAQAQTLDASPIAPASTTATETTTTPSTATPSTGAASASGSTSTNEVPSSPITPATATTTPEAPVAPMTAATTSNKSISHWLCGDKATPLLLTNDENKGLIQFENSTVEMNLVPTEKGVSYNAVDGSGTSFTIMNNAAVLVAANKDKTSCALIEQPAVSQ